VALVLALLWARPTLGSSCDKLYPNTDVSGALRSAKFPNGVNTKTVAGCCAACDGASDCLGFVYAPAEQDCWPLAAYDALVPVSSDRIFGGKLPAPPPPPSPPPPDWAQRVAVHDMLFASSDTSINPSHMPEVGNGFLATQVMGGSVFCAGLFNGYLTKDPSHRARLPATNAIRAPGDPGPAGLDVRQATYYRRSTLAPSPKGACTAASARSCTNAAVNVTIEQRWYAHRARPAVLVHEVQILPNASAASQDPLFAVLTLENTSGGDSADLTLAPSTTTPPAGTAMRCGSTRVAETNASALQSLCILTTLLPSPALQVPSSAAFATYFHFTVVRTSIETAPGDLEAATIAEYSAALGAASAGRLHAEHVEEWDQTIWASGFETDRGDLAAAVNSSLYAILSSVRNDREFGLSPGGLTGGYNGHGFWDTEIWMYPAILLTQ
jgi:hypothetical protein